MSKRFANGAVLSGVFTLLASFQVLSDEAGKNDPLPLGNKMEAELESGRVIDVYGGRVTRLVPTAPDIADIRILAQPGHGHVSVNPDNTIALVLTGAEHTGALSFRYEVARPDGQTVQHEAALEVIPSPQKASWGTGVHHYMLPVDASDRVIVEHGSRHRKVYVSGDGLTAADIAARQWGVAESDVTLEWLQDNPDYGASEELALHSALGIRLWESINGFPFNDSNWLLLERGHDYNFGWAGRDNLGSAFVRRLRGESPLHPVVIGAWGTGDQPRITSRPRLRNDLAAHIVVRDINFTRGFSTLNAHKNFLFEGVTFGAQGNFQGNEGLENPNRGFTFRNSIIKDVYRSQPALTFEGKWEPRANRVAGMFVRGTEGLLFDGVIWDHIGWAPDFAPDGSIEGGHPPSMFSHNMYIHKDTRDVTMRNSITMRSSSYGAQFRGGAFIDNNLFLDNNIPVEVFGGDYGGDGPIGDYSLLLGSVTTVSARRGAGVPRRGALDWGVRNIALLTSMVGNIVAHANDPDDPNDTYMAEKAVNHWKGEAVGAFYDDTIIWRWGIGQNAPHKRDPEFGTEANVEGLDPEVMNATTIQRYTADLLNQETATVDDFGQHLRTLDGVDYTDTVQSVLGYFRAGFGVVDTAREDPADLRFVPDPRGDGVRWDNRLNWGSGDLPGTVAGDSVDLGGNRVVFGGTVTLDDLTFGPHGGLVLTHGRLRVTGDLEGGTGATIDIDRAGQLWTDTTTGDAPLSITVNGGRFVNAGSFNSPVRLTASRGQTLLAIGGSDFHLGPQSHLHVDGAAPRVGFDGDGNDPALVRFEPGARLDFTVRSGRVSTIEEFRSGAFGAAPAIGSGIDLGGASLTVTLTDPAALDSLILIDVDELVGTFEEVSVQGLGDRDASIVINYESDTVSVQLSSGTGQVTLSKIGTEDMIDRGNSEIRNRLDMAAR